MKLSREAFARLLREFSFIRGNILVLMISWTFFNFAFSLTFSFESPYIRALGAPASIIGLMGSLAATILSLVRLPGAYIADKYGRKQIIVTMTFMIAFTYLLYIFAPDWRFVLIGMIFFNLSLIYQPALQAIHADSIPPEKRGMGYAVTHVVPHIPTIIAPAIAGVLVASQGLISGMRIVYTIVFFCCLAAAITRLLFLKETLKQPKSFTLGEVKNALTQSVGAIADAWKGMSASLKFLTVALLISAFEEPIWFRFMSLYVFDVVKITEMEWGFLNTAFLAALIIFGLFLGKLVDKFGRKKSLIVAYFFVFTPSNIIFLLSQNSAQLLIAYILFGIGEGLVMPAYNALQADMIPREKRGRIMGTIGTLNTLAIVPASALGGYIYEFNPVIPFVLTTMLGLMVGFLIFIKIEEPKKREK